MIPYSCPVGVRTFLRKLLVAIPSDTQKAMLQEYEHSHGLYGDYCRTLGKLIETLLSDRGIQTHTVSYRAKSPHSLTEKVTRPDKGYTVLSDITDLAGVRITTYFADDVDKAAELLRAEFAIDENASIDKRQFADPDRFGYMSLHHVLSLGKNREALAEYAKFKSLKCEVQVRSILQHAWAEIEHDLGYKSAAGVPAEFKRKFARIASLLELADDEFSSIRDSLAQYERAVPEKIRIAPQDVSLDLPSFKALYSINSEVSKLDLAIASATSLQVGDIGPRIEAYVPRLHKFGIRTVDALERKAAEERETVVAFARYWLNSAQPQVVNIGFGVFYLLYVLAWRTENRSQVFEYLSTNGIGTAEEHEKLTDRIMAFEYKRV